MHHAPHPMKSLPPSRPGLRGLSAAEVAIALATLAVLAAVVSPSVMGFVRHSRFQEVVDEFEAIEEALVHYYEDTQTLKPLEDIAGFGEGPDDPAYRHLVGGDGREGWSGPYLRELPERSSFGGTWDIDVLNHAQATILLGTRDELGGSYPAMLETVNAVLDGDADLTRGIVWGDAAGIHVGFNYEKP